MALLAAGEPMTAPGFPSDNWGKAYTKRSKKLTARQREDIIRRYQDGEPAAQLAAEFKVTASYVHNLAGGRSG